MRISGAIIAHAVYSENIHIGDNVSCQLPSIEFGTSETKGSGILGSIDMPMPSQINSMTFSLSSRGINKTNVNLAKPGVQNLELRFNRDVNDNGVFILEGTKIFISGVIKKFDSGKVEEGATMDGSMEYEVLRYRKVIDGVEVLLIDKLNYIYKVNGVDYMEKIRASL